MVFLDCICIHIAWDGLQLGSYTLGKYIYLIYPTWFWSAMRLGLVYLVWSSCVRGLLR